MNTQEQTTDVSLPSKKWEELTAEERSDRTLLRSLLTQYERALEVEGKPEVREVLQHNLSRIASHLTGVQDELRKQIAQKTKELEKHESEDEKREQLVEAYKAFLKQHEIYYVASHHEYMEYFSDNGRWEVMMPQALHKQYAIRGPECLPAFDDALAELCRKKVSIDCSFYPKPERYLNLMRKDHWLQPIEGEPHYAFDLLIRSLGNNKQENMDHIEQVTYWKYRYPEEYRLPCMVIYGEGGAGKNTFVNDVLGTIFGQHQVLVADAEKTLGQFNGLIQGRTVVMIDEAIADKINAERLKRTVGNRTIDINPKYGKQGEHDNTPLYMAGGNDNSGAILLAGNATDRRWSILKVEKSIIRRLEDLKELSHEKALEEYKSISHVYSDPEEVGKWLHHIAQRWSELTMPPVGLHEDDYKDLLVTQKSPFDELVEMVFGEPGFTHITGPDLYKLYQAFVKEVNPSARAILRRNKFYAEVRTWVSRNAPDIVEDKVKIRSFGKLSSANAFFKNGEGKTFDDNSDHYLNDEEGTNPFWVKVNVEKKSVVADDPTVVEIQNRRDTSRNTKGNASRNYRKEYEDRQKALKVDEQNTEDVTENSDVLEDSSTAEHGESTEKMADSVSSGTQTPEEIMQTIRDRKERNRRRKVDEGDGDNTPNQEETG